MPEGGHDLLNKDAFGGRSHWAYLDKETRAGGIRQNSSYGPTSRAETGSYRKLSMVPCMSF